MAATDNDLDVVEIEDSPLYCLCKQPYNEARFMIECDVCKDWFHGECVGVEEYQASEIDVYHCPKCQRSHGPLQLKIKRRKDKFSVDLLDGDISVPITKSVKKFVKSLKTRSFRDGDDILKKLRGYEFDKQFVEENGLHNPILVENSSGLDLTVPPSTFTVGDVELLVGSMRELDVINVAKQSDVKMLMREFVEYYNNPKKDRILNVISLEFSKTELSKLVIPPRIVDDLSWVSRYWPDHTGETKTFLKPEVQKYCLMSVKDSYTDFHVDFGGTSVWYHIVRGKKVFYLIEPTDTNIALYETWASSASQNSIFFGDQVDACYKVIINPGETLFIPTGWIHGVYTPEDSLVFGGNFLHDYSIALQLDVFEMENRIGTPSRFQFPNFETLCWFAAKNLSEQIKDSVDEGKVFPKRILAGCEELQSRLSSWLKSDSKQLKKHKENLPEGIPCARLLREFSKSISLAKQPVNVKPEMHNRKTLLGLKFKLNRIDSSLMRIKESPPPPVSLPDETKFNRQSDSDSDDNIEEKKLKACFSDDTYVYPSLLESDEEDGLRPPRKRKKPRADIWRPTSKVSEEPETVRPRRESAKKQRLRNQSQTQKHKTRDSKLKLKKKAAFAKSETSSSSVTDASNPKLKPKKGEKTAKQRLGKLLKIHKFTL